MELTEPVETVNKRLIETFGFDTITSLAIWRVSWSEDQFEWRHGTYVDRTPGGGYIRTVTETRFVPKYRQWIDNKYVLERLVIIPDVNSEELPKEKMSYEPLWVFEDKHGNPLPPKWEAIKFIIDSVYAAQYGTKNLRKYVDPESTLEGALEAKKKRIEKIEEELYGDDSSLGGSTINCGESIIMPQNFERNKES